MTIKQPLTEAIDTTWVLKKVWPFFTDASLDAARSLVFKVRREIVQDRRVELGYHPYLNNQTQFKQQFPRHKWKYKTFTSHNFNLQNKNWNWLDQVSSKTQQIVEERGQYIFRELSKKLTRYIRDYVQRKYGDIIQVNDQEATPQDIFISVRLRDLPKHGGEFGGIKHIHIYIPTPEFVKAIVKMVDDIRDEDADYRVDFNKFLTRFVFENLVHELTHLEQSLRYSPAIKSKQGDYSRHTKTFVRGGDRGAYDSTDPTRYHGFTNEIDAFSAGSAAKLVRDVTYGLNPEKHPEQWNAAVNRALNLLRDVHDTSNLTGNFRSMYAAIKKALMQEGRGDERELQTIWKRFLKMTYIRIQSYKV